MPTRPIFPPQVNRLGYGMPAAIGMIVVAAIVIWLLLGAERARLRRRMGSSAIIAVAAAMVSADRFRASAARWPARAGLRRSPAALADLGCYFP